MIIEAACWAHGLRKFFELAELREAPVAIAVGRRNWTFCGSDAGGLRAAASIG